MTKKKFLIQGAILSIIGIFMKSTNVFYRSYLSNNIDAEGMGLYQLIFSVFTLAVTLSTSGISLAVTRLVSSLIAQNKQSQIKSTVFKCLMFCLGLSLFISCIFFSFSDYIAENFLGNIRASDSLKILGIGLPFMSSCTCIKGYFLSVDEGISCGFAELFEQIVTIVSTVVIFSYFPFKNIETALIFAMIASTVGEMASFLIDIISLKLSLKRHCPKRKEKSSGVIKALSHIALPCTLSCATRSLLCTFENLLIPNRLQKGGFSYSSSMAEYGLLQGMAMPILFFPSAFIGPFASLLIPKICLEKELNHKNAMAYITEKAVCSAVGFGVITFGCFWCFSDLIANVFYGNGNSSFYIKILSPLVPLMYLDIVVDCLLKGLDEQLNSMKYNILDASLRVVLVYSFMSIFGMKSYLFILALSVIFNASLSLGKVISVTKMRFTFVKKLFYQIPLMSVSVYFASIIPKSSNQIFALGINILVSFAIYYFFEFLCLEKTSKNC